MFKSNRILHIAILLLGILYAYSIHADASTRYTTDAVRIRSKPSTSSSILAVIDKGTAVTVYGYEEDWADASCNGVEGYICTDYLSKKKPSSVSVKKKKSASTSQVKGTAKVNADDVNLRKKAGGSIIDQLDEGTKVTLLSKGDEWTKIKTSDGSTGYIYSSYLGNLVTRSDQISSWKEKAVKYCRKHLDDPYSQEKRDEKGYYDCSSLMRDAYKYATGQYIGDTTVTQNQTMEDYLYDIDDIYDVAYGDIVYHMSEEDEYHCGIYIGDGAVINASQTVGCVKISYYDETSNYWEIGCKAASYCYDKKNP